MASISDKIKEIEEVRVGSTGSQVLLVEGENDEVAFRFLLKKKNPHWEESLVLASAGNKKNVLKILKKKPSWYGVVDADEWGANEVPSEERSLKNLFVLPRFCIENYLMLPEELWMTMTEEKRGKVTGGFRAFKEALATDFDLWVAHGVLWSVVLPLWSGIRGLGFKEKLLDPSVALDETVIKETLKGWYDFLDPEKIWADYQSRLVDVKKLPQEEQLKRWVHGKYYFKQYLTPKLNQLFSVQKEAKEWKKDLFESLPLPSDLDGLGEMMELSGKDACVDG